MAPDDAGDLADHAPLVPTRIVVRSLLDTETFKGQRAPASATADVPASPLTRVDLNVASGLERAVKELRGSDLIVGWSGKMSAQEFFFGSVLEKLLQGRHHSLIVSHLVEPLKLVGRVVVALPPDVDLDRSFPRALKTVKLIAKNAGAPLVFLIESESRARAETLIRKTKPSLETHIREIESWSSVTQAIQDGDKDGDLLILYVRRDDNVGWRPLGGSSATPMRLTRRFPGRNILALYPADPRTLEEASLDALTVVANDPAPIPGEPGQPATW